MAQYICYKNHLRKRAIKKQQKICFFGLWQEKSMGVFLILISLIKENSILIDNPHFKLALKKVGKQLAGT